jgi:hypothetical protein
MGGEMSNESSILTDAEQELVRKHRAELAEVWKRVDDERKRADAAEFETQAIRWMVRGIVAHHAHLTTTINTHMDGKELMRAVEAFGAQASHCLLRDARLAFQGHAQLYVMRQYIRALQNHIAAKGFEFRELGEDNYSKQDIFDEKWVPPDYWHQDIFKAATPPPTHIHGVPIRTPEIMPVSINDVGDARHV